MLSIISQLLWKFSLGVFTRGELVCESHPAVADHSSLSCFQLQYILTEVLLAVEKIDLHRVELLLKGILVHTLQEIKTHM